MQNLEIYNEHDAKQYFNIAVPYRPQRIFIFLIKNGAIEVNYNFSKHIINPFSVLILRPGNAYEFKSFSEDIKLLVISFNQQFQSNAAINIRQYVASWFYTPYQKQHYEYAKSSFDELWTTALLLQNRICNKQNSQINEDIVRHQFLSLIYLIVDMSQNHVSIEPKELNIGEQLAYNFTQMVSLHYLKERNISFYANKLNVTSNHLSDTVKTVTKHTPRKIINLALLTEAKILLAMPDKGIKQIAEDLKFSDQYVFSKFFKRLTHITPKVFQDKL
jgi:AraC family transcriptional activator of pobA